MKLIQYQSEFTYRGTVEHVIINGEMPCESVPVIPAIARSDPMHQIRRCEKCSEFSRFEFTNLIIREFDKRSQT